MGLTDFQIYLQNPLKVFFAGESISGQVVVNLSEKKNMAELKVELLGRGEVRWTETRRVTRRNSQGESHQEEIREHYSASENYMSQQMVVFHGPSLGPGIHVFPFVFSLPTNLPSSFESQVGHVRYFLKADIVRNWKWNHKVKTHITVNSIVDLNMFPSAKQPGHNRDHKSLCCLCCKSGPISAMIATNRTGYVPGELIGFSAEVENQSNRRMKGSFLNLTEVVTYKTRRKNKQESRVVAKIHRPEIGPGAQDMWEDVRMKVPAVPPTNLGGSCSIIDVHYTLDFHVEPSGLGFDLVVSVPIMIGTIPLTQYIASLAPPPMEYLQAITVAPAAPYPSKNDHNAVPPYPPSAAPPYPPNAYPSAPAPGAYPPAGAYPPGPPSGAYPPAAPSGAYPPAPTDYTPPPAYNPSAPPDLVNFSAYPNLPPPTYAESVWGAANVRNQDDGEHTKGDFDFVPRYVSYNTNY